MRRRNPSLGRFDSGAAPLEDIVIAWRGRLSDEEMCELVASYGGAPCPGWWDRIRPHSFGWVTARDANGRIVGFVNIVSDGGDHAFLLDTKTRGDQQRRGIGTRVVELAAAHARAAGHEWLHVDFADPLRDFYVGACGFEPTPAGLLNLRRPR